MTSFPRKNSMRNSLYRPCISRRFRSPGSVPSLGIMPDNMSAALEFSRSADGGTRSLKGCMIKGGNCHTVSPSVVVGDMFLLGHHIGTTRARLYGTGGKTRLCDSVPQLNQDS